MFEGKCYIVAEIGGNFTDLNTAKQLIDAAKRSGVDAVKLQTFRAETLSVEGAMFDMEATGKISQYEYFKKYELDENMHKELFAYAIDEGLEIFSSPSHYTDVELLEKMGVSTYKIGADDLTNLPMIRRIADLQKPIMLSTGMATMKEIHDAVDAILERGNDRVIIMHVVSLYPTAPEYVNLEAIHSLQREFPDFMIGYSDHTMNVNACIFAAVMGAKVVEKHFTYDKKAEGPDHMHSATESEMKYMVDMIRQYESMRGNGVKKPVGDEIKNRRNNRKSLVYSSDLEEGHILADEDIEVKRPGTGMMPDQRNMLIGKRLGHHVAKDALISVRDFV